MPRRLRDDRGRWVAIAERPTGLSRDGRVRVAASGRSSESSLERWGLTLTELLMFAAVLALGGYLVVSALTGHVHSSWIDRGLLLVLIAGFVGLTLHEHSRHAIRRCARALLEERRCPSCAYDLQGLAPAPDGCTVCPECGAAWRTHRP